MYIKYERILDMFILVFINIIENKLNKYEQSDMAPDEWTGIHDTNISRLKELKKNIDRRGDSLDFSKKELFFRSYEKFTNYNVSIIVGDYARSDPDYLQPIIKDLVDCIDELINIFIDNESIQGCYNLRATLGQEAEKMKQSDIVKSLGNELIVHRIH
ncbi:hypothetical protein P3W45_000733 [Vairimorpha bombi]|jgi:alanyl-tRNA synthetase